LKKITLIDYHGIVQYETIGELIHRLKQHVHSMGIHVGTYKRILLIMIETLENIMKHSKRPSDVDDNNQAYASALSVTKHDGHFIIASSNLLEKQKVLFLKEKLNYLNELDKQGLKDFYKETITNGEFTNTGGAGLGLIEIAKISGNKIKYEFEPINELYTRLALWITINESPTQ
jgi:hypothetical protein